MLLGHGGRGWFALTRAVIPVPIGIGLPGAAFGACWPLQPATASATAATTTRFMSPSWVFEKTAPPRQPRHAERPAERNARARPAHRLGPEPLPAGRAGAADAGREGPVASRDPSRIFPTRPLVRLSETA